MRYNHNHNSRANYLRNCKPEDKDNLVAEEALHLNDDRWYINGKFLYLNTWKGETFPDNTSYYILHNPWFIFAYVEIPSEKENL